MSDAYGFPEPRDFVAPDSIDPTLCAYDDPHRQLIGKWNLAGKPGEGNTHGQTPPITS